MTTLLGLSLEDVVARLAASWNTQAIAQTLNVPHDQLVELLRLQLEPRKLWSTKDAARTLGVPYRTVCALLERGELPLVELSRYRLIPDAALDAWIAAHTTPARKGPLAATA